ncbi:MAG: SpoIIE family protein phosphatase, partial [Woeseia sp.]|nr:SpoIIE family protein phosphatase [Woeseia sp.]
IRMPKGDRHILTKSAEETGSGEISRESLVKILEIMGRLASPEELPELLREIIEVGKVAIVAEAGVLWLYDHPSGDMVMVVPSAEEPRRIATGEGLAGQCADERRTINISNFNDDAPLAKLVGFQVKSLLSVPILGQDASVLGVMQWLGVNHGQFDQHDEWIAPALAAEAAIAIQHTRFTDELLANAILHREVAVAREIQISTLPREMPTVPGYDLEGRFLPTDHTGGDLYDLVVLDGRLFMLLGDATGHGFGPALSSTQMQAMLRVAFRLGADLDTAYMQVNNQLTEDLPDDRFITAFMGFLNPETHEVTYHSGGQGPILHYHAATAECEWHKPTSFPVGAMEMSSPDTSHCLTLAPGDVLALISDGVYEYANSDKTQFGEERVGDVIRKNHQLPMSELCQVLIDQTFEFGANEPQADDITLVLVKRES